MKKGTVVAYFNILSNNLCGGLIACLIYSEYDLVLSRPCPRFDVSHCTCSRKYRHV